MAAPETSCSVVVPTTGRASLGALLSSLARARGPRPDEVVVVDDRPQQTPLLIPEVPGTVRVVRSGGVGPAGARNRGWREARGDWIAFLDDDVLVPPDWAAALRRDLSGLTDDIAASQAVVQLPLPADRAPTDWERGTAALSEAWWITADMAYRRSALALVGGFDESFPRAFREDADLALRVRRAGYRVVQGNRRTEHPVRESRPLASVRQQAGNVDNALMRRRYGHRWRSLIGEGPGRIRQHLLTTAAATGAVAAATCRMPRTAVAAAALWAAATAEFAQHRIAPGPRTFPEVREMLVTSALIPPVACWHRAAGELRAGMPRRRSGQQPPAAVLVDRDGTLIEDVPYNGDPDRVEPRPGAAEALDRLRAEGLPVGVVTNQSGIARGLLDQQQVQAVHAEVERLLGPFNTWQICPHGPDDGCRCRKPGPGLVERAAAELGVAPSECVVIGDIGSDVAAAESAGASAVLVPTERTLLPERRRASHAQAVAPGLVEAAELVLEQR